MEHTNSISKELGKVLLMLIISSGESQSECLQMKEAENLYYPSKSDQETMITPRPKIVGEVTSETRGTSTSRSTSHYYTYIVHQLETTLVFMAGLYNSVLQKNSAASFLKITCMSQRWGKVIFEKEKFKITASEPHLICKTFQLAILWFEVGLFHLGQDGSLVLMKQWISKGNIRTSVK